jgi:hypothetical protein
MNPLDRFLSKYFFNTLSLFRDMLYRGLYPSCLPGLSLIWWSYRRQVSSLLASAQEKTCSRS